jgi:hypothetical protein
MSRSVPLPEAASVVIVGVARFDAAALRPEYNVV